MRPVALLRSQTDCATDAQGWLYLVFVRYQSSFLDGAQEGGRRRRWPYMAIFGMGRTWRADTSGVPRSPERESPPERQDRDRGFSMVEIVISIVLLGTVVLAVLNATTVSIKASAVSRSAAQVETSIVNAADRVNRAPKRCDYTIYAQAAVQTEGWDPSTVSVAHEYYVVGSDATVEGSWVQGPSGTPGCEGPAPVDLLVQRVTISITSPDSKVTRTIQVVKSDV